MLLAAALYPIDTIKTRLQVMIGGGGLKALLQAGGGKALYAGVWGNLAGALSSDLLFRGVDTVALQGCAGCRHDAVGAANLISSLAMHKTRPR